MGTNEHNNKKIDDAINSFDGAQKASPRPFLFTRLSARMYNAGESSWEKAGRVIARPAVVIAGLLLILAINAMVLFSNNKKIDTTDQAYTTDAYNTTVATLYNFENGEQ